MVSPACKPTTEPRNGKFVMPYIRFVLLPVTTNVAGFTVSTKLVVVLYTPSLTPSVIVALPSWFDRGVTIRVRFVTVVFATTRFAFGIKLVSDEEAVRSRFVPTVWASKIVNGIAVVGVFTVVVLAVIP